MQAAGAAAAEAVTAIPARGQVLAENLRAVMSRIDAAAPTDSSVRMFLSFLLLDFFRKRDIERCRSDW